MDVFFLSIFRNIMRDLSLVDQELGEEHHAAHHN
jgi:hypothetical protein